MKQWSKMLLAILLAMTLFFTGTIVVAAEEAAEEDYEDIEDETYEDAAEKDYEDTEEEETEELDPLKKDVALAHYGAVMTAKMQKKAFQLAAEEESAGIRQWELLDMAQIYTFDPVRYLVMNITEEQAEMLKAIMSVETMGEAAIGLGEMLNSDYEYYADAARDIVVTQELYSYELTDEFGRLPMGPYVAFFTYNRHLDDRVLSHIVVVTGDDETIGASFVISSEQSALTMDESFVTEYSDLLGFKDLNIRLYSGDELSWIMGWNEENPIREDMHITWGSDGSVPASRYVDTIKDSPEMLKLTFEQKEQGIGFWLLCAQGASEYMYQKKGLDDARYVSGEFLEMLRWEDYGKDFLTKYLGKNYTVSIDAYHDEERPEIIGSEGWDIVGGEIEEFPEDAKVLIVFHRYVEDTIDTMGIDWIMESAFPIRNIPESLDEVDYIIYCDVTYGGDKYTQGNLELIYPYNHITVHDAKTGEIVKDLGEVVRRLSGFTTVTSTITYWQPLRVPAWERIRALFPVPEISEEDK